MGYWAPLYDAVGRRIGVLDEATAGWQLAHLPEPLALEGADCFQDSCRRLHNLCWVGPPTLTHRALLSLEAQLARLLLPLTRCPDSNQPPLVFANQAKKILRTEASRSGESRPLLALHTGGPGALDLEMINVRHGCVTPPFGAG